MPPTDYPKPPARGKSDLLLREGRNESENENENETRRINEGMSQLLHSEPVHPASGPVARLKAWLGGRRPLYIQAGLPQARRLPGWKSLVIGLLLLVTVVALAGWLGGGTSPAQPTSPTAPLVEKERPGSSPLERLSAPTPGSGARPISPSAGEPVTTSAFR